MRRSVGEGMESDIVYFKRRTEQEYVAANQATHPKAKRAHFEMAEMYGCLVALLVANERRLGAETIIVAAPTMPEIRSIPIE